MTPRIEGADTDNVAHCFCQLVRYIVTVKTNISSPVPQQQCTHKIDLFSGTSYSTRAAFPDFRNTFLCIFIVLSEAAVQSCLHV